jgi:hypothetical protein
LSVARGRSRSTEATSFSSAGSGTYFPVCC